MRNEQVPVAGADAQLFLYKKVNIFLFDLKNEAKEHGFKAGESWHLEMAAENEIISLKRTHHPVISMKLKPEVLLPIYIELKKRMQQPVNKSEVEMATTDLIRDEKQYLAAYPARIQRK